MLCRAVITIFFVSIAVCLAAKDYYQVLGVDRSATTAQIKRAFKKLALKHHPDKSDDPKASEKFMEITTAYETLFNEDKRKAYDRLGHEAYVQSKKQGGTPEEEAAFTNFFRQSTASSPDHEGYFESFDKFFSGGFGPGQGGMYFRTDGAPMFQVHEQFIFEQVFARGFPEFEFVEKASESFSTGEKKEKFKQGGYFRVTEPSMFEPVHQMSEMLFSIMRETRQQNPVHGQHRHQYVRKSSQKVESTQKKVVYNTKSGHVNPSTRTTDKKKVPTVEKFPSHSRNHKSHSHTSNSSGSSRKVGNPSACKHPHCEIDNSLKRNNTAKARNSTQKMNAAQPKMSSKVGESHEEDNHDNSSILSLWSDIGFSRLRDAALSLFDHFIAFLDLAFSAHLIKSLLFVCTGSILLLKVCTRVWKN